MADAETARAENTPGATAHAGSDWVRVPRGRHGDALAAATAAPNLRIWQKDVADGHLTVQVGAEILEDGPRWHLSISHRTNEHPPRPGRYPSWDEIKDARYRFMPGDINVAQLLPPQEQWISVHDTTFHLWQVEL